MEDNSGNRATRSGFSLMTSTASRANATRNHATARSRCSSQLSSGVILLVVDTGTCRRPSFCYLVGVPHQHQRSFKAVIHFQLVEDIGEMSFYGFFTDENFFANLFVGEAFRHKP